MTEILRQQGLKEPTIKRLRTIVGGEQKLSERVAKICLDGLSVAQIFEKVAHCLGNPPSHWSGRREGVKKRYGRQR